MAAATRLAAAILAGHRTSVRTLIVASGTQTLKFDNDPSTSLEDSLRDQVHFISKRNRLDF